MNAVNVIRESNAHLFNAIMAVAELTGPISKAERDTLFGEYQLAKAMCPEDPFSQIGDKSKRWKLTGIVACSEMKLAYGMLLDVVSYCEKQRLAAEGTKDVSHLGD